MREKTTLSSKCAVCACIAIIYGALVGTGCAEPPPQRPAPVPVHFVVDRPFDGELTVYNEPGALSPTESENGQLTVTVITKNGRSAYDFVRWPAIFKSTGSFKDGKPIEMLLRIDEAEYSMQVIGWDDNKNMILRMSKKGF